MALTLRGITFVLVAVLVAVASAPPGALPTARAAPDCDAPGSHCVLRTSGGSTCGVNQTVEGQTCVRRIGFDVGYDRLFPLGVGVQHENSNGEVHLLNTPNTWTADRTTVTLRFGAGVTPVTLYGYHSDQGPPTGPTGQTERVLYVAWLPLGANVQHWNGEPVWCTVFTPAATLRFDCNPRSLLLG